MPRHYRKHLLDIVRIFQAIPYLFGSLHKYRKSNISNKTLAVIKVDEIGDYIIFRNYLEKIRISKKFKDYHITLIGNIIWKEIAEHFDKNFVDEFIWIDKKRFIKSFFYRKEKLKLIHDKCFEIMLNPLSSRNFLIDDSIVKSSLSKERVGYFSDTSNSPGILNIISNKYYTRLYTLPENIHFEFFRNKFFFENILDVKISIEKPSFNEEGFAPSFLSNKYVAIFPGASKKHKKWPIEKFAKVIDYIKNKFNYEIVILGGKDDFEISKDIINQSSRSKIHNLTGKTSLIDLINYIKNAELLVSNDTGAAHIGASANVNTIILSDGSRFGRFIPYPTGQSNVKTIFPPEMMKRLESLNRDIFYKIFKYKSFLKISDITSESVISEVDKFLQK